MRKGSPRPTFAKSVLGLALVSLTATGCESCGGTPSAFFGCDKSPHPGETCDGIVTTDPLQGSNDRGRAVVVQPGDRKIVVAGKSDDNFLLVRYEPDGSIDDSFRGEPPFTPGFVSSDFLGAGEYDEGKSLAIDADGKIVLAGISTNSGPCATDPTKKDGGAFALARYDNTGAPDKSFGDGGFARADFDCSNDEGKSVVIDADGKIVVAGQAELGTHDFALARFDAVGQPDKDFGDGGKVTTDIDGADDEGNAVVLQDGMLVVVGYTGDEAQGAQDFAVIRYTTTGDLDTSFNKGGGQPGIATTHIGDHNDIAFAAAVQPLDSKIVVAGTTSNGSHDRCALARYTVDGEPDPGFDTDGVVIAPGSPGLDDICTSVAVQEDGKIVVAGKRGDTATDVFDFLVMRFDADGALDLTFGDGDGFVVTKVSSGGGDDGAYAMTLDPTSGDILAVGESHNGKDYDFAVVRYYQ